MIDQSHTPKTRRGLWGTLGSVLRGPVDAFNPKQVAEGAQTIGRLVDVIKAGPQADPRIRVADDRALDLAATAFLAGASRTEIERQLCNRRRQTAVSTYCYLAGGAGFLALWTCEALLEPTYARLPYIVALIGLCGVFFLSAFYNALVNWQARTLRLGTAREFLATDDSWWPS
jgi:hypothetical protein